MKRTPDESAKCAYGIFRKNNYLITLQNIFLSPYFKAFLCGLLGALGMAPLFLWPILLLSLAVFFTCFNDTLKRREYFMVGYLYGLGYFTAGLYWIGNALLVDGNPYYWAYPLALLALPAFLSLFYGVFGYILSYITIQKVAGFLASAALLALTEWIRGHIFTGFPWNLFGYTWGGTLEIAQSVSVFGIYGLTLITIIIGFGLGFIYLHGYKSKTSLITSASLISMLGVTFIYGHIRMADNVTQYDERTTIRLVQPSIPQAEKWDPAYLERNFTKHLNISKASDVKSDNIILLWPETSINPAILNSPQAGQMISNTLKSLGKNSYLFSGALIREKDGDNVTHYNAFLAIDKNNQIRARYNKSHLVPFGEYLPFENYLPIKPIVNLSGFQSGSGPKTLFTGDIPSFSPLICYEAIFPGDIIGTSQNRKPEWIINVTNDAWYGVSSGPYQHLTQTIYRAIEEGLPLYRAASTGVSAAIDPIGRTISNLKLNKTGYTDVYLIKPLGEVTPYSKFGDIIFMSMIAVLFFTYILSSKLPYNIYE